MHTLESYYDFSSEMAEIIAELSDEFLGRELINDKMHLSILSLAIFYNTKAKGITKFKELLKSLRENFNEFDNYVEFDSWIISSDCKELISLYKLSYAYNTYKAYLEAGEFAPSVSVNRLSGLSIEQGNMAIARLKLAFNELDFKALEYAIVLHFNSKDYINDIMSGEKQMMGLNKDEQKLFYRAVKTLLRCSFNTAEDKEQLMTIKKLIEPELNGGKRSNSVIARLLSKMGFKVE